MRSFLLLALVVIAAAQQPTIRVTTRLVQVSVIVRDRNGPVEGIKQEDFQIFDQGKPQKIALFHVASTKTAVAAAAKVPPGVYTNEPQHGGTPIRSVTVVLIDLMNTKFSDQAYARAQLIKFLKTLEPQDRVALYLLANGVKVLHDFTHEPARLARAIAKLRGDVSPGMPAFDERPFDIGIPMFADSLSRAFAQMQEFYTIDRAKTTLVGMEAIGNHLMHVPGRKNLVWISGSFPFSIGFDGAPKDTLRDKRNFGAEAERASRALSNANVSIYPVDARGLIIGGTVEQNTEPTTLRNGRVVVRNTPFGNETMELLAERTGGRAFYNTNDIRGAIREALNDAEVTYTLGFYPTSTELDARFHDLKVKVDRKNVDLRHRKGYFAAEIKPPDKEQMNAILRDTLAGGLDATGVTLSARVELVEKQRRLAQLAVAVDLSTFPLDRNNERWTGNVEFAIVQLDADGKQLAGITEALNLDMNDATYRQALQSGVTLRKGVPPEDGAKSIRVAVIDRASGRIGSLTMPFSKP